MWSTLLDGSTAAASPGHNVNKLPAKAVIEGASSCFRLLGIDQGGGLRHEQFAALLMSATDNR